MSLPSRLYASAGIPTHARSLLTAVAPEPRRKAGGKTQGRQEAVSHRSFLPPAIAAAGAVGSCGKRGGPEGGVFQGLREDGGRRRRTPAFRRPAASTALVGTPPRAFPKGLFTHRFCGRPGNHKGRFAGRTTLGPFGTFLNSSAA